MHVYFPSDDERDAYAVHAIRTSNAGSSGYAQNPDCKSFSNVNGAELLLTPSSASLSADQEQEACLLLDTEGNAYIEGKTIEIHAEKNLSLGEPAEEGEIPVVTVEMAAEVLTMQVGEDGAQMKLTQEAEIIAEFVKMEAAESKLSGGEGGPDAFYKDVTRGDVIERAKVNIRAGNKLVDNYVNGREEVLTGAKKAVGTVISVVIALGATTSTAGVAGIAILGGLALSAADSDIGEGLDTMENSLNGSLEKGYNRIRDNYFGGDDRAYEVYKKIVDIALGIVTAKALANNSIGKWGKFARGSNELKKAKAGLQILLGVGNGIADQFIYTGKVDPLGVVADVGIGYLQGYLGNSVTNSVLSAFGMQDSKLLELLLGTGVDTGIEGLMSALFEMPYDFWESLERNGLANLVVALIIDPVDAATGTYVIRETDSILASLPSALKLERTYRSTQKTDSVFGRGWSFPYASRIFRDTRDMENPRIHMNTVTGHSLCYEKRDGVWVNLCKGTSRFVLEVKEGAGQQETEVFLLTDVMEHTVYVYDREGRLSHVEYPNCLKLELSYGTDGLERITTPLGNVLEIESKEGRILQITDEIGRCTRYRYAGDFLTDVVYADEGITHYEYDSNGCIISVTDQNGSRYIENEYDQKGRITRQGFTSGVYQTLSYDDAHRRNTVYYSETGKTEVYEYNENLLIERIIYDDGTYKEFAYSDDNMRISETGRMGYQTEWEYDVYGRTVREKSPDGYEVRHEYDQNHDLMRTLDSDGRETQYAYDHNHNLILRREKISDAQWKETAKTYDAKGRCISEKDALGNETVMEYDDNRTYPRRVITPKGEETSYTYDRVGRRMSIGNEYGTVELAYNSRNFVTKRTDGEGHTWHQFYDRMGKLTASFTPSQWEDKSGWEYRYDFLSRVEDTISPLKEHKRVFRNFDGEIINEIHPVSYAEKGADGEGTRYGYDIYGNCIRIRYADGGVERRFYDADGNMVKQVQPESYDASTDDGAGYRYAYDSCGRMTQMQDPDGNVLHAYEYNGHGQIIRETDGEGKEVLYIYNTLGWKVRELLKVKDEETPLYRVTVYKYDSQGNKVEEAYGQQEVQKDREPESWHRIYFSYDKNNHLTLVKDDFGAQMRYDYDCLGNVTLEERVIEEGVLSTVHYDYNKNGMCIQRTEKIQGNGEVKSAVTKYAYDADGNLTQVTTPKGFEIRREYDTDGRLTQERVIDKKNGIDRRERYVYDEAGNIVESTVLGADGERLETFFKYDLKDRLTRRTEPSGVAVRYIRDRNDRLLKETGPYGYQPENDGGAGMSYAYDSRGNRIKTVNALDETVQEQIYNLQDLPKTQTDAYGNRTDFDYEADGQLKEVRRGDNIRQNRQRTLQKYEYNATGQIIGIIDGNQNRISYDVDGWGRITGVGFADGVKEGYGYTPAGQVSRTVDGNGNIIQYRYNSLGKVSERTDQLGYKETYQYDEEGNLVLHTDRDGRRLQRVCNVFGDPVYEKATDADGKNPCISTWHYDSIGRIVRAVSDGHSYEYIYDEYGNLKEKRSNGKRLVSYTHDAAGQITEIKDPAGIVTKYEYDIMGRQSRIYNDSGLEVRYKYDVLDRISHIRYGNGVETAYAYDADGNISRMETKAGETVLLSFAYEYDGNGNRTAKTGMQMTAGSGALDISYDYDVRGQLLEERRNDASVRYAYDKAGNRVKKTDSRGEIRYLYNAKNQLLREETEDTEKQFTYDRQGGIIKETNPSGIRLFSYDSRHRQTKVETEDGNVQENRYDVENLRFELLENGKRTRFIYHDGELLHEEGGKDNRQTGYHLGAGIEAFTRAEETYYYQQDEQLSTAFITGKNGAVHNSYRYDAFGNELETVGQLPNRICYTGQQYDDVTGQYYLRARYYNPILGRFMQEDTYQGDGLNLYAYCNNNPVMYYDPSGYMGLCDGDDIGGDAGNDLVVEIELSKSRYPESAKHIQDAIADGHPEILTIDRGGAKERRKASLKGVNTISGLDRDEYPPAMSLEGGKDASVRHIAQPDNRGSGSSISQKLRGYSDGTKYKIVILEGDK